MVRGKSVLVTGGTGSLGRALTQRFLLQGVEKLIIFSRDELKQFEMAREVTDERVRYFIGDVRDKERLRMAFDDVNYVVHAAAMKQVPACEYNPFEAVKTNVLGAQNIIEAAIDKGVSKVLAASTDKAVEPLNLYGATKACMEKLFIAGNSYAGAKATRFSVVRYGNVVGSRGSVIPFFKSIAHTGKLPITHEAMTRFWITLGDAAELVDKSLRRMAGGEVFVPKLPSMRVVDLADAIAPGCEKPVVGIRPGEKVHELLITRDEARRTLDMGGSYLVKPEFPWWTDENLGGNGLEPGFEYSSGNNDWWLSVEELKEMLL